MLNGSNLCIFEGIMVKDPEFETIGKGNNAFTKAKFTIAVRRKLTKDQRDAKKKGDDIVDADFPRFVALGGQADAIQTCVDNGHLGKSKPIRVIASYENFSWTDKNGDAQYGHDFKIEEWSFVTQESQGGGNSGGGNRPNKNNNNNNNKGSNKNNRAAANEDTYEVDDDDIPF